MGASAGMRRGGVWGAGAGDSGAGGDFGQKVGPGVQMVLNELVE